MKLYSLERFQSLPIPLDKAWDFLSSPKNLSKISPPYMGFKIVSYLNGNKKIYHGQVITYKVKPIAGIPLRWVSEISQYKEPNFFVDEQKSGPFKFWKHEHYLKEIPGGTEMRDMLQYAMPFGILGSVANSLIVRKQLEEIFDYRRKRLEIIFGEM